MTIQRLPQAMVQLMAAGEVIDSPAAVVRELVENALDAGATRITLAVQTQPWEIQVTDNGAGLALDDLRQAASPHSTSKWGETGDLWQIQTLGFRGEALHSLSQLAQLTVCSRPQGEATMGYRITYDRQGLPKAVTPVAMAPGTQVTVTELFGPLPPRQQAAPAPQHQTRAIQQGLYALALCHPHVTWQGHLEGRPWFTLWPGESALPRLPQVMARLAVTDLRHHRQPVTLPEGAGQLELVLGLPDRCHRGRPDGIWLALNHRPVHLPALAETLAQVLRRSLPRDRHPVAFVHVQAPCPHIDWHRSPDKSQVYLRYLETWCKELEAAITATLTLAGTTAPLGQQRFQQLMSLGEGSGRYALPASPQGPGAREETPNPLGLRAIAQVHNRYILAEHPAGLCLVEQHIAHERVLYEALCDRWHLSPLPTPIILPQLSPDQVAQLQRIGLAVDPFGPDLWAVRTAPDPLIGREDCGDALLELSQGTDLDGALVAVACRTALRNGTPLSTETMVDLLGAWQRTRHPQTCPHGRPICLTLKESSLARYFRRHWVIGKSHGLE